MTEYLVPYESAESEFEEKRSRFISHVFLVESEAEARARIDEMKKKYYDARHNCWCFVLHDGTVRYGDDGEPQGTAGQPMLNVFQRENVENVVCVVTRYFGGILLGAGGLVRAYAHSAKLALDTAGRAMKRVWARVYLPCSYSWYERLRLEVTAFGGIVQNVEFGADVSFDLLLPQTQVTAFLDHVYDLSAGTIEGITGENEYRAFPLE